MSLASWALVMAHHREPREPARRLRLSGDGELRHACALLLAFGLLAGAGRRLRLRGDARRQPRAGVARLVLVLALLGAGSKAGLVPLHVWLPLAHPAAPSHVSALMSGVMTKVADLRLHPHRVRSARAAGMVVEHARRSRSAASPRCMGVLYALMQQRPEAPAGLQHDREHRHHLRRRLASRWPSRPTAWSVRRRWR